MSLLGKILIFFNLLAAGAYVYYATQDWKGRQSIAATALRYKLPIVGLPFEGPDTFDAEDETSFKLDLAGNFTTETVSKKILDVYFQGAAGGEVLGDKNPVPSQLAEIKRVKAKIETVLKDKSSEEKVEFLNKWLIDQCETFEQRVEVQTLVKTGNAPELEKRLYALFDVIIAPPSASTEAVKVEGAEAKDILTKVADSRTKPFDASDRQTRAAQLLTFLSQDAPWQKRVMMVVGLRRYVGAIVTQAARLRGMSERLERLIVTDQAGYLVAEADLNQMARDRTDLANRQSKLKKEKVDQKSKEDDFVSKRQTQLGEITDQLRKIKAEVDAALVSQGLIEAGMFEIQREVAITLDEIYKLEADLDAREHELLKAAKKAQ